MMTNSFENISHLQLTTSGLTEREILSQRARFGNNDIVEVSGNPWLELAKETLKDPMIWFLAGIGTIFVLVGDKNEAVVLFLAILPLVLMDAILHRRTQASTGSLKNQLASESKLIRDGKEVTVASREIVPGDLMVVTAGEYLAADGYFEKVDGLQVDESALTGESLSITKKSYLPAKSIASESLGFAGTRALTGHGLLRVLFTGRKTSYGEIVDSVANVPHDRTPLQKSISKLVQFLIFAAAVLCLLLAGVRIYQGHGWLDALVSSATLAVAAIPEEFPVVFTFFLGVGVYRLAKRRALVRRAVSVENIGRISFICTDKTGTITLGQLTLTHIDPPENVATNDTLITAAVASDPLGSDPVDQAIREELRLRQLTALTRDHVFPFTEDRKRESAFAKDATGQPYCFVKGSPETILSKSSLPSGEKQHWLAKTSTWAKGGHKVLACAKRTITAEEFERKIEPEGEFMFHGLLAFEDPPRGEVADAIDYCSKNGIRVLMITGDHPETAVAIAKDIGLGGNTPVAISAEAKPEQFEESWLKANPMFLKSLHVVARCTPLQKLRIVNALRDAGELVAVTGDGVNDVPALKAADIGIAMGIRGTSSAKEVASIVLADDNFSTITNAIMEGRQLFSNLKLSFEYLLLIHIPFVLTAALIPLFGFPLLYLPVHIVWLELIIHPSALFAFQQQATKQARKNTATFFSTREGSIFLLIGLGLSAALTFVFVGSLNEAINEDYARAKVMLFLACWSASLVAILSGLRTRSAIIISSATILSTILLIQVPVFGRVLHVSPLQASDYAVILGLIAVFAGTILLKRSR